MSFSISFLPKELIEIVLFSNSIGRREICSLVKTDLPTRKTILEDPSLLGRLLQKHFPTAPRSKNQSAEALWAAYKEGARITFCAERGLYHLRSITLPSNVVFQPAQLSNGLVAIPFLARANPREAHTQLGIWDLTTGEQLQQREILGAHIFHGPHELLNGTLVYLSSNSPGEQGRGIIESWNPQTNKQTYDSIPGAFRTTAYRLAALIDRNSVVSCTKGEISIWDLEASTKNPLPSPEGGDPYVDQFAALYPNNEGSAAPSQSKIAVSYRDRTCRVWDPQERTCVAQMQSDQEICSWTAVPNGTIAIGRADHTIQIWDPIRNKSIFLTGHTAPVTEVTAISDRHIVSLCRPRAPGGRQGAAPIPVSADTSFRVWDTETGAQCTSPFQTELDHNPIRLLPNGAFVTLLPDQCLNIWTPSDPERTAPRLACPELLGRYSALASSGSQLPDGKIIAKRQCDDDALFNEEETIFDIIDLAADDELICAQIAGQLTSTDQATQASGEARFARAPEYLKRKILGMLPAPGQ